MTLSRLIGALIVLMAFLLGCPSKGFALWRGGEGTQDLRCCPIVQVSDYEHLELEQRYFRTYLELKECRSIEGTWEQRALENGWTPPEGF